jgi:hypothetical protein
MGGNQSKSLLPTCLDIESRSPEELKRQEDVLDRCDRDNLEHYRVIQDMLIRDEIEYKKDIEEYRRSNGCYVVKSRALILRGEELQVRRSIVWD